ncbi:MAG: biopolymer transporter ExbD [Planctomycetia bacterium]|nr:biopolymer transporter ExbD [Planctomycetia bacterium]
MKSPKKRTRALSINITPLIDVTFLLIVFFVTSSRMIQEETAMELELPREATAQARPENDEFKIIINVTADGSYFFGAREMSLEEIRERMKNARKLARRETSVCIRADRATPYAMIEPILVVCAKTGFTNVSFAATAQ